MTLPIAGLSAFRHAKFATKVASTLDPESNEELTATDIASEAFLSARESAFTRPSLSRVPVSEIPRPPTVDMVDVPSPPVQPEYHGSFDFS